MDAFFRIAWPVLVVLLSIAPALFFMFLIFRTICLLVARPLGLANPKNYHKFPRLPWRALVRPLVRATVNAQDTVVGGKQQLRWTGLFDLLTRWMYRPGFLFLGRLQVRVPVPIPLLRKLPMLREGLLVPLLMPVGSKDDELSAIMVAGPGAGKTNTLISILALHGGNAFVVDPAGELAKALLPRCGQGSPGIIGKGGTALALDAAGLVQGDTANLGSWNVFDELDNFEALRGQNELVELATRIATALIPDRERDKNEELLETSRGFIKALLLHMHSWEPPERRTLAHLHAHLSRDPWPRHLPIPNPDTPEDNRLVQRYLNSLNGLLDAMSVNPEFRGPIDAGIKDIQEALAEGRATDRLLSARNALAWTTSPTLAQISARSSFSLRALKDGNLTLFVCAQTAQIKDSYKGWFRLLTTLAVEYMEDERVPKPEAPTLIIIDEMPALGYLEPIKRIIPEMRKHRACLLGITQSLDLLRAAYGADCDSMIGLAGITLWAAPTYQDAEFLANVLGGMPYDRAHDSESQSTLATAAELHKLLAQTKNDPRCNVLVHPRGGRPMVVKTPHYYQELPVYYYRPRSDKQEARLRRLARYVLRMVRSDKLAGRLASEPAKSSYQDIGPLFYFARWILAPLAGWFASGFTIPYVRVPLAWDWLVAIPPLAFAVIAASIGVPYAIAIALNLIILPSAGRIAKWYTMLVTLSILPFALLLVVLYVALPWTPTPETINWSQLASELSATLALPAIPSLSASTFLVAVACGYAVPVIAMLIPARRISSLAELVSLGREETPIALPQNIGDQILWLVRWALMLPVASLAYVLMLGIAEYAIHQSKWFGWLFSWTVLAWLATWGFQLVAILGYARIGMWLAPAKARVEKLALLLPLFALLAPVAIRYAWVVVPFTGTAIGEEDALLHKMFAPLDLQDYVLSKPSALSDWWYAAVMAGVLFFTMGIVCVTSPEDISSGDFEG
jgi:hypothetical protein